MIRLLDNGFVRLVDSMGSDLSVVRAARVSHAADWRTGDDAQYEIRVYAEAILELIRPIVPICVSSWE